MLDCMSSASKTIPVMPNLICLNLHVTMFSPAMASRWSARRFIGTLGASCKASGDTLDFVLQRAPAGSDGRMPEGHPRSKPLLNEPLFETSDPGLVCEAMRHWITSFLLLTIRSM